MAGKPPDRDSGELWGVVRRTWPLSTCQQQARPIQAVQNDPTQGVLDSGIGSEHLSSTPPTAHSFRFRRKDPAPVWSGRRQMASPNHFPRAAAGRGPKDYPL
jgi:hypothetical protein